MYKTCRYVVCHNIFQYLVPIYSLPFFVGTSTFSTTLQLCVGKSTFGTSIFSIIFDTIHLVQYLIQYIWYNIWYEYIWYNILYNYIWYNIWYKYIWYNISIWKNQDTRILEIGGIVHFFGRKKTCFTQVSKPSKAIRDQGTEIAYPEPPDISQRFFKLGY